MVMACDLSVQRVEFQSLTWRVDSPGVPRSPRESTPVVETLWRRSAPPRAWGDERSTTAARRTVMPWWSTARISMRTTVPRCRIRQRDSVSARCGASSQPSICNASRRSTAWCRISSGWADICCGRPIIVCCEGGPSSNGKRLRVPTNSDDGSAPSCPVKRYARQLDRVA